jgi:RNA polymerase sigma factor (TIGR02999 family)
MTPVESVVVGEWAVKRCVARKPIALFGSSVQHKGPRGSSTMDPTPIDHEQATILLQRLAQGDRAAQEQLMPIVYGQLHQLAERALRGQEQHTLQPTALVNEAYIRVLGAHNKNFESRSHFLGIAAKAMRSVLVDHARRGSASKRGGDGQRLSIDVLAEAFATTAPDMLGLDEALTRLSQMDEQLGRIVELRFFGGLSVEETAGVLGVSEPTIVRGWRVARMWLQRELE